MQIRTLIGLSAAAAAVIAPAAVVAQASAKATVDSAKAAGIVGEQADGLLGFVTGNADAGVRAAVAEINAGRLQLYREAAARNGVSVEAAGASAYTEVVQSLLQPGQYFKPAGGGWTRK